MPPLSPMKNRLRHFFIAFISFAGTATAFSQNHSVDGTVTDKFSGAPVAYTVVHLPDLNKTVTADENGRFLLKDLPGNWQRITFVRVGYKPLTMVLTFTDTLQKINVRMEPGNQNLEEVVIVGTQSHNANETPASATSVSQRTMRSRGALSISDGISRMPGMSQLSTGAGISKPVIRGLYGNRIQTVVMGMRFDNQQWQDEHGLGLQDIGIDRVEVIKGPAALMYGSEAMGGVVNILEEDPADLDSTNADATLRMFSNTYGAAFDAGVRSSKGNYNWRIRAGMESQADYSDGANRRVLNSRFDGYVAKATFGYSKNKWVSTNNYLFSKSDFGFIMDSASAMISDARWSRNFANPHHTVFINLFTSQNTFFLESGIFRIIFGAHINRRMEDEGGGGISLDMQLVTAALHLQYEQAMAKSWTWINGIQAQFQDNKNFGFRMIVPDATLAEGSLYSYVKFLPAENDSDKARFVFEGGLRFDTRQITTFETGNINTGLYAIPAISKLYTTVNGSAGISVLLVRNLHWKANVTSGYRTPNLAELSSNGVHEGTYRYEIGDVNMKIEQNLCAESGFSFETKQFEFTVTGFNNRFLDYIYLQPTDGDYFGFRIYRYTQTNATLQGGEVTLDWTPEKAEWFDFFASYSTIRAKTDAGNYLPFIPADRLDGMFNFRLGEKGRWKNIYLRTGGQYYFPQNRPAQFETATPDYFLMEAGIGCDIHLDANRSVEIDLSGTNLLNEQYYDHLSRFKEFGIYNIGRNISFNLKYKW
jgi:iron complex outermembrane recepter protein